MLSSHQAERLRQQLNPDHTALPMIFAALADRSRYQIFQLLIKKHDICVTDVANILGISVPAASQQLRILETAGLINRERRGQMICYSVKARDPLVKSLMRIMASFNNAAHLKYR